MSRTAVNNRKRGREDGRRLAVGLALGLTLRLWAMHLVAVRRWEANEMVVVVSGIWVIWPRFAMRIRRKRHAGRLFGTGYIKASTSVLGERRIGRVGQNAFGRCWPALAALLDALWARKSLRKLTGAWLIRWTRAGWPSRALVALTFASVAGPPELNRIIDQPRIIDKPRIDELLVCPPGRLGLMGLFA